MGCCGCSNKSSAITAGIFGLIQGIVGLIFNGYFLNLYATYSTDLTIDNLDDRLFLVFATRYVIGPLLLVLGLATFLHSIWIISSILLLIGNASDNTCCIRQWVAITSFVIIGDIIFPLVVVGLTIGSFSDVVRSVGMKLNQDDSLDSDVGRVAADIALNYYAYYAIFLFSFCKLGLITIIVNICLNVFTNRRAKELSQTRGYVIGTTVTIVQGQATVPSVIQVGPPNPGFPGTFPIAQYAGNIPLQPANNFGPAGPVDYDPSQQGYFNPYRNDQSDPLLPPKDHQDHC